VKGIPTDRVRRALLVSAAGCALAAPAAAGASITVSTAAQSPALRVDARGYAEVSWAERGARRTLLIPPAGRYLPGGRLAGPDVSRPVRVDGLAFARVVRRTPDGRLWALQSWQVQPGRPAELRFARWRGPLPVVEAVVAGGRLSGRATLAGRGIFGTSPTTAGTQIRHFALVDCLRCQGSPGWRRLLGVRLVGPGGTFRLALRPTWRAERYRVTVAGPNRGWTYAPDATTVARSGAVG
jgi:hypothetical protein